MRIVCPLVLLVLQAALVARGELRVGRGSVDDGAVKALVLDDGEVRVALVVCDQLVLSEPIVQASRKLAAAQSSLPEGNIMISATGVMPTGARAIAPGRVAEAIRLAASSLQAGSVWAGSGRDEAIGFYDRFLMKDGTVRANPGRLNPEVVQPAGEADPDLTIALFESAAGSAVAIYGAFSLHSGTLDYVAPIGRTLAKVYGGDLMTLWSVGAGANVSNIDVRGKQAPYPAGVEARRIGSILAGETMKAVARSVIVASPKLGVARETLKLKPTAPGAAMFETEVQVIALGATLAWVGLPGELWTELGMAIRKASPFEQTLLVGLGNGSVGVLPVRKAYGSGHNDTAIRMAAGSGETVADAAVRLLGTARRQSTRQ